MRKRPKADLALKVSRGPPRMGMNLSTEVFATVNAVGDLRNNARLGFSVLFLLFSLILQLQREFGTL